MILDPVTFQILRHRMEEILAEMYHTIVVTSGNPTLYEAGDHEEAICDVNGNTIVAGGGVTEWTTCLQEGVKYLIALYKDDPGFKEGEQWLHNYSYGAAVHGMDVQVLAPVFYKGQHVAWVVTAGHQMDIGGACPGGVNVEGYDFFGEGLLLRGIRLFGEGGKVKRDVEESIRGLVRTPDGTMLGIYASVAANNVGKARLIECFARYSMDTILTFFSQIQDYSEALVRARLREIPDGSWHGDAYIESMLPEEEYLRVSVAAIKEGDEVTLDFSGSSPTSRGSQNIGTIGAISNCHCAWLALMCFDIPWSAGAWRPLKFILPEGTIVNPRFPAATSSNTPSGAGYICISVTYHVLSNMLSSVSSELRKEAIASSCASGIWPLMWGEDHKGEFFSVFQMDGVCGGQGATEYRDGDNSWGNMWGPKVQISNIETAEFHWPILYVMRRETQDSGGVGKFRGGNGIMLAYVPWDNAKRRIRNNAAGMGTKIRMGHGLAGGYPCANVRAGIIRNSKFFEFVARKQLPACLEDLGKIEDVAPIGSEGQGGDDVYVIFESGGGGYGDPLDRDPKLVLQDVISGDASIEMAREAYGVAIDLEALEVDLEKTEELRQKIREQRLKVGKR